METPLNRDRPVPPAGVTSSGHRRRRSVPGGECRRKESRRPALLPSHHPPPPRPSSPSSLRYWRRNSANLPAFYALPWRWWNCATCCWRPPFLSQLAGPPRARFRCHCCGRGAADKQLAQTGDRRPYHRSCAAWPAAGSAGAVTTTAGGVSLPFQHRSCLEKSQLLLVLHKLRRQDLQGGQLLRMEQAGG